MSQFTDQERDTIRTAAFGAMGLVSKADPGFFDTFKESMAGSKALASASPDIQSLLKEGGFPQRPAGSNQAEVEQSVVSALQQSMTILRGKDAQSADSFREVILAACQSVADAAKGTSPEEAAAVEKIRGALA